jgi:CRISPR-associated protein Cas5h
MKKIVDICRCNEPIYLSKGISLGLGTAFNLGWIEPCDIFEGEQHGEGIKMMNSIIPMNRKLELIIDDEIDEPLQLIKEKIPAEFDNNREITQNGLNDVLVNLNGTAVKVKINQSIELNNGTSIVWIN